jgi:hypothetical protein
MITTDAPNQHGVTVESGPASKGGGFVVVATKWSIDRTAMNARLWARFDTEEEADREAGRLAGANWPGILSWHRSI